MLTPLGKNAFDPYADWSVERIRKMFGYAELSPAEPVVAGEFGSWEITYHVGAYGLSQQARVALPFKSVGNWGQFQAHDPSADNYFSVECSDPDVEVSLLIEYPFSALWAWSHAATAVPGLPLGSGEWIRIKLGDRSCGSRGWQTQLFAQEAHQWSVWVDPLGARHYMQVPGLAPVKLIAGPAEKLIMLAPSTVMPDEPAWLSLRLVDRSGNTATHFRGRIRLKAHPDVTGLPQDVLLGEEEEGVCRIEGISIRKPGVVRLEGEVVGEEIVAASNPILCQSEFSDRLYFGDPHCQSNETQGTNTAQEIFQFARDVSCIDFISHQANDWELAQTDYEEIQRVCKQYNEAGRFVTFPGYEYSADPGGGGDHNVLYLEEGQPIHRSGHFNIYDRSGTETDRYPLSALLDTFRGRDDVIVTPHIGGRPAAEGSAGLDPDLTPYIEICSSHGRFEWFAREAIKQGLSVGFLAGSDDHTGRPGASYGHKPRSCRGGLAGVYATELTRSGIWQGLQRHSVYATTGERIVLDVGVSGAPMGQEIELDGTPVVSVRVHATKPLWSVEVLRDLEVVYQYDLGNREEFMENIIRIAWTGSGMWQRTFRPAQWDGELHVTDGRITGARRFAYHTPLEPITEVSDGAVHWKSTTVGDIDSLEIELEHSADTTMRFVSQPLSTRVKVADILKAPQVCESDDLRLIFEPVPRMPGPLDVQFDFTDRGFLAGRHAYWVRVMQEDTEMAWSTPIWVTKK